MKFINFDTAKKSKKNTTYRMGENIHKQQDQQALNFQNIQAAHTTQHQKNKQPNQKVGNSPKETFLQK